MQPVDRGQPFGQVKRVIQVRAGLLGLEILYGIGIADAGVCHGKFGVEFNGLLE